MTTILRSSDQEATSYRLALTEQERKRSVSVTDDARTMGIHICAGRGSGKSRFMGRLLTYQDFVRGVPLVILDPGGPTIRNFLDKLICEGDRVGAAMKPFLRRVRYVDMAGTGDTVVPWPLYYRLYPGESLYRIAMRPLEAFRRLDPNLKSASVQGWNAMKTIGSHTGMVLAALGYQITEAGSLLSEPERWRARLEEALRQYPHELRDPYRFFTVEYPQWSRDRRDQQTASFRSKIDDLVLDPASRAMVGAPMPAIDWQEVVEDRLAILLDFSRETTVELRRFKMLWVLQSFLSFIQARGFGRHRPISLVVDELASMYHTGSDLFAEDMDELINVIARNARIWLTLAHQELYQFDERTQKTLLSMGTQIIGVTEDWEAAERLARQFYQYDPFLVKRYEQMYGSVSGGDGTYPMVVDQRPVEYTMEEQFHLAAYLFRQTPRFHFAVRVAPGEGTSTGQIQHMHIENLDRGVWVNEKGVRRACQLLGRYTGQSCERLLTEIDARCETGRSLPIPQASQNGHSEAAPPATMKEYGTSVPVYGPYDDDEYAPDAI